MKKIALTILSLLALLVILTLLYFTFSPCGVSPLSCGDYPTKGTPTTQKIMVGGGPEDMAIDTSLGTTRIIVSCAERRPTATQTSGFYAINPRINQSSPLTVIPSNFSIHPHGIDVVTINNIPYLYAISHEGKGESTQHRICRFAIQGDSLLLDADHILTHPLLTGPNDLDVLEDGSFFISNPMPSNDPSESTKSILGIKNGTVLHFDGQGNWSVVLEEMCYPNGVWVNQDKGYLLVANGGCREVLRYQLVNGRVDVNNPLSTKQHDVDIPIGDNLMIDQQGVLWTAAHPCPLKFLDHIKDAANKAPMQVFAMDPMTLKTNMVFQNNGELISTASTVVHLGNRLYISQVFDPFVLVVEGWE